MEKTPENISDIIENTKDWLFKDYYYATPETKLDFQVFLRLQIEQLLGRIDVKEEKTGFGFDYHRVIARNTKSNEIANQLKDLIE